MGKPDALTRRQDLQEGSRAAEAPPHTLLKPGQFIIGALQPPTLDSNLPLRSDILSRIRQLQPEDDLLQQLLPYLKDSSKSRPPEVSKRLEHLFINNRLVYYKDQIYIPDNHELKMDSPAASRNSSTAGHLGQAKTHDLLTRHYYFPGLRHFVNTYVAGCHTCARNKVPRQKPYGPFQSLPGPSQPR